MYLLDANVFIEAKKGFYGFDFCPGFWDWLSQAHAKRRVFSIDKVRNELLGRQDDLTNWAKGMPPTFFLPARSQTQSKMSLLTAWSQGQSFTPTALNDFYAKADYYLVAQASELGYTVVTLERPDKQSKKRVKIPDACDGLKVAWMTPFDLLRAESVKLVI